MVGITFEEIARIVDGDLHGDGNRVAFDICTDSRIAKERDLFVALRGERFDAHDFLPSLEGKIAGAIAERFIDISYPLIVVGDALEAMSALAKHMTREVVKPRISVALTGSVGKTTTKEMVSSVLSTTYNTTYTKGNLNNHIGVPLTLLSATEDTEALVCEMGMNHKGEIAHLASLVDTDIAIITNIGHSHIENLGSREGIRDAKLEILASLKSGGKLIINGDEPLLEGVSGDFEVVRVGLTPGLDVWADKIEMGERGVSYTLHTKDFEGVVSLTCIGRHNVMNSLFAVAVGLINNIDIHKIKEGLLHYKPVGMRQNIYVKRGIRVIEDCYNAGVESMKASLKMLSEFSGRRIAVLSDMLELGEHSAKLHTEVGETTAEVRVDALYTVGKLSEITCGTARDKGVTAYHFDTKDSLADALKNDLREGDTVLFKASRSMKLEEVIALSDLEK